VLCTLGGRVPRARAEPPREAHSAGSQRLRFPVGVAACRSDHLIFNYYLFWCYLYI